MTNKDNRLTTLFGNPVGDRENTMTAGPRGPLVMQDPYFLDMMAHFDREVIPDAACTLKVPVLTVHSQ